MRRRYLSRAMQEFGFAAGKMCFVSGPRQCGKTTLAKMLLAGRKAGNYYNFDETVFRRKWVNDPGSVAPPAGPGVRPLLVLDEIHKDRLWKRTLKGIYDTLERSCDILVTGSARLNVYRRGGDSLLGRYFHFRLHPFTLGELHGAAPLPPEESLESIFSQRARASSAREASLEQLMEFGPFPEPLLTRDIRRARLWRRMRRELVLREDLRDLSRLPDLGRVELLAALLPERVGSPLSLNTVSRDMEVSYPTAKRWISYLKELYYLYEIKPYHRSIPRALKKEGKFYLWDFGEVEDPAARFENLVANHLLKACHYWTDVGEGVFDLHYLRNKERHEIDFLVVRDGRPWLPVEVKLRDTTPSPHWRRFLGRLPVNRGLQVVSQRHRKLHEEGGMRVLVAGAAQVLRYLP